ncbi:MAG: carbohydrate kinase family protein [Thermoplasmata archaeon]|nr:carbohydrate kinase family protein [Thermoplasmata archaeon]
MGRTRVLTIGNTVLDVIGKTPDELPRFGELAAGRGPADIDVGGNGAIAAAEVAILGSTSSLASTIGKDAWGRWLKKRLDQMGVDTRQLVTIKDAPTATTLSLVRTDGERALLTHNGASASHDLGAVDLGSLEEGDWLLVASLFLVGAYSGDPLRRVTDEAHSRGAMVALDLAWDCTGDWDLDNLAVDTADIVLGNDKEVKAVACATDLDAAVEKLMAKGIRSLVVKMGPEGARVVTQDGLDVTVPALEVDPINATGTGDVFNAALMVALSEGKDMEDAVRFACAAGAVRVAGGCHKFPTREEVDGLLAEMG